MEKCRNNVAIMFTDVVGHTAMMGENEARTIEVVNQIRTIQKNIIKSHSGVVVKELGDGVLAYFPNALGSVKGAIEIQQTITSAFEAKVRIGIHKSDVVFSEGDIFGDGVNIASRIEPLADPGGVFISASIVEDLGENEEIGIKLLGSAKLKNFAKSAIIYAVQAREPPEASVTDLYRIIEEVTMEGFPNATILPLLQGGFTDSHFFLDLGIVCYGYVPTAAPKEDIGGVHGNNERITEQNLHQGVALTIKLLERFATDEKVLRD
jgi:class 3 adenylate cyclase